MRGALVKKRYGIPAALLLVLLLSGTALAWYCFENASSVTTVQEPLSTEEELEFPPTTYPGETSTWSFKIVNSGSLGYSVRADLIYISSGVSITEFIVAGKDKKGDLLKDLLKDNIVEFNISPGKTVCRMVIKAAENAAPGKVSVRLDLSRG